MASKASSHALRIRFLVLAISLASTCTTWVRAEGGDTEKYQVRIAWGGTARVAWQGHLRVTDGEIVQYLPLGTESDLPATFYRDSRGLAFSAHRPIAYQATDLIVRGTEMANLEFTVQNASSELATTKVFPLRELWRSPVNVELAPNGSRILVQSIPGDELRVEMPRDNLVFSAGEQWQFEVSPRRDFLDQESGHLFASVTKSSTREVIWRAQQTLKSHEGRLRPASIRFALSVPGSEGVYELKLRFTSGRQSVPFSGGTKSVQRTIQFVVVDEQRPRKSSSEGLEYDSWKTVLDVDPTQPRWWDRLVPVPTWNRTEGNWHALMRKSAAEVVDWNGRNISRLSPGGWQAIPLSIGRRGEPHIVELEYPRDQDLKLAVGIIEADDSGNVLPRIVTGGIVHQADSMEPSYDRYRLLFWPRTDRPALFVKNMHTDWAATYASVRVRVGPRHLPEALAGTGQPGTRVALASFDEPVILDMFSAIDATDPISSRQLTDWTSFLTSTQRLAEYLHFAGFDGVAINVWTDGSGIVPLPHWESASRYDTGGYFNTGQDPLRKDVLELIFRVMDREGLKLVPGLRFSGRLPELESLVRDPSQPPGIELTERDGRSWRSVHGAYGKGHLYNPIDPRVQDAIVSRVRDLVTRYGHHRSFSGVRIELGKETYTTFPDEGWGLDLSTLAAFTHDASERINATPALDPAAVLSTPELREEWIKWRAVRLSGLFQSILVEIRKQNPKGMLYLSGGRLADAAAVRRATAPALPRAGSAVNAMLELGLDWNKLGATPGIVVNRPLPAPGTESLVAQGATLEFQADAEVDAVFSKALIPGSWVGSPSQVIPLPCVNEENPASAGWMVVVADATGAGMGEPLERSCSSLNAQTLMIGGWRPSLGNVESIRKFLEMYRELPVSEFEGEVADASHSVLVRQARVGDAMHIWVTNRAQAPARVRVAFNAPTGSKQASLSPTVRRGQFGPGPVGQIWELELAGHAIAATRVNGTVEIDSVEAQFPPPTTADLRNQISELLGRTAQLRSIRPLPTLSNPGFEPLQGGTRIPGWELEENEGCSAHLDLARFHSGASSLQLSSNGPACPVRSEPIAPPTTGRLALQLQVRREQPAEAPLRIGIEGRHAGRPYFRFALVDGQQVNGPQAQWSPFVLQIADLPDAQLEDLRVRLELLGAGEVWIDDIQVFDLAFSPNELNELSIVLALADVQLSRGELAECQRTLTRYWPRFLRTFVPPAPRVAEQPQPPSAGPARSTVRQTESLMHRVRQALPVIPGSRAKR